jgi:hypothetical protein
LFTAQNDASLEPKEQPVSAGSMPAREIVPVSPQMEKPNEMAAVGTSLSWYFGFFFVSGFCLQSFGVCET